jgi:hypothetical protein
MSASGAYDLVDAFRYATDDMPSAVREELMYRLLRDAGEIPSDLSSRYIRDTMLDLGIPPRNSQRLEVWLGRLMELPPDLRRSTILQMRRAIL